MHSMHQHTLHCDFNSIMVRLRQSDRIYLEVIDERFNSIMVRLRPQR